MKLSRLIGFMWLMLGLAACSVPTQSPESTFLGIDPPKAGAARFYLLRPAFSDTSRGDSPLLSINGKGVVRLSSNAYTDFNLKPGTYRFALRPGRYESSAWQGEWKIDICLPRHEV